MAKFVKLTLKKDANVAVLVNIENIVYIHGSLSKDGGTVIQFTGNDDNYIEVAESAERIMSIVSAIKVPILGYRVIKSVIIKRARL